MNRKLPLFVVPEILSQSNPSFPGLFLFGYIHLSQEIDLSCKKNLEDQPMSEWGLWVGFFYFSIKRNLDAEGVPTVRLFASLMRGRSSSSHMPSWQTSGALCGWWEGPRHPMTKRGHSDMRILVWYIGQITLNLFLIWSMTRVSIVILPYYYYSTLPLRVHGLLCS